MTQHLGKCALRQASLLPEPPQTLSYFQSDAIKFFVKHI
jgi:hypothetical protein